MNRKILFVIGIIIYGLALACTTSPQDKKKEEEKKTTIVFPDPAKEYSGSESCRDCHLNVYNRWKESLHASFIKKPEDDNSIISDSDFNGINDFKQGIVLGDSTNIPVNDSVFRDYWYSRVAPALSYISGEYNVDIKDKIYPVSYIIGGSAWKQLFLTKLNNLIFVLPIQYVKRTNSWFFYDSSVWFSGKTPRTPDGNASWEKNCSGCHTTGLVYAGKNDSGDYTTVYKEFNVGCESCHGSGLKHVAAGGAPDTIINPEKLTFPRANDICARCHMRGRSVPDGTYAFAYNDLTGASFKPGENLEKFFAVDNTDNWSDYSLSKRSNHAQASEFAVSAHAKAGLTCFTCHDPHNGNFAHSLKNNIDDNSVCLNKTCHSVSINSKNKISGITVDGNVSGHTKHSESGSKCVSCHMPFTGASAATGDLANHSFNILYPVENNLIGNSRPNSCMNGNCHTIRDNSLNKWNAQNQTDNYIATMRLTDLWGNLAPVSNAGDALAGYLDSTFVLNGDKSFDPNDSTYPYNDGLTYKWIQKEGPADIAFDDAGSKNPSFIPVFPGKYLFELTVNDSSLGGKSRTVEIVIMK
ncbi:hypothetical protein HY745_11010 [Candidatus Desantisbacteria bacterium]|nr:hypothetical protein [Candidatus Desantisbacteria bacterium]